MLMLILAVLASAAVLAAHPASAQYPVIDNANLQVARENAEHTRKVMESNDQILQQSQQILRALSGNRTSDAQGQMLGAGLGGGMSVAGAPSWGSILSGGTLSFGSLSGNAQNLAATLINGLQLVRSLKNLFGSQAQGSSAVDSAYTGAVNTASLLAALTSQASQGVQNRSNTFTQMGGQIGTTQDVKGSIDQNSQVQVQTGLTVNELIGVTNGAVAALNAEQIQRITRQSETARFLTYDAGAANPFASSVARTGR